MTGTRCASSGVAVGLPARNFRGQPGALAHLHRLSESAPEAEQQHVVDDLGAGTPRATRSWQEALERYEQPPLDPAVREALDAHVARCKETLRDIVH